MSFVVVFDPWDPKKLLRSSLSSWMQINVLYVRCLAWGVETIPLYLEWEHFWRNCSAWTICNLTKFLVQQTGLAFKDPLYACLQYCYSHIQSVGCVESNLFQQSIRRNDLKCWKDCHRQSVGLAVMTSWRYGKDTASVIVSHKMVLLLDGYIQKLNDVPLSRNKYLLFPFLSMFSPDVTSACWLHCCREKD